MNNLRVLLVEDTTALAKEIADILEMTGYTVHIVADGNEGMEAFRTWDPDLIITDLIMRNAGGLEFIERIRKEEELRHTPVIILSARVTEEDQRLGIEAGADIYLKKPCCIDALLDSVTSLLNQHSNDD
jgi:DNA-binding response OmpR family regulator